MSTQNNMEGMLGAFRVLDLTDAKGVYCGQNLGSLGADVIKIESPGGDPSRNIGPFYQDMPNPEKSLFWMGYNTNKRGITLDIQSTDGREVFKKLVKSADVVVESYRPGFMDELGLGYEELEKINPKIIMTSISPFGRSGPYRDLKASDLVSWAMSGMLFVSGDSDRPPVSVSHIPLTYLLASMDAALSTAIALYWRGTSDQGQQIDVSIQESANKTAWMIHERWEVTGQEFPRGSSYYQIPNCEVALRLVWQAKDGYVMYMIFTGQFGADESNRLVQWLDEEGFADDFLKSIDWVTLDWRNKTREEGEQIQQYYVKFFQSKTKAVLLKEALKREIMIQPVSTPKDIMEHPQLKARGYWQNLEHDDLGITLSYPTRFCMLSATPCKQYRRAPNIGEHNTEIYQEELGYSAMELTTLKQAGVL
ncbi:CaiB/BaiF CoA transferase family protein [Thermodesulfobacteriota bacterium]